MKNRICILVTSAVGGWLTSALWIKANLTLTELGTCVLIALAAIIVRLALPTD